MYSEILPQHEFEGPVYQSFVLSVYSDYKLLLIGVPTSAAAVVLTAHSTNSTMLYILAVVVFVLGALRYITTALFHKYHALQTFSLADYEHWERVYTIEAVLYCLAFGAWCLIAAVLCNPIAEFTAYVVTFGNLIGICGRCFPISRLVNGQLFAVGLPLIAGLLIHGGEYILLAIMLAPYMVGLQTIASRQRDNLFNNVVNRLKAEKLALQFHNALENVPQGICMFDSNGNLEVANRHIGAFIGRSTKSMIGLPMDRLIDLLHCEFSLAEDHVQEMKLWMERPNESGISLFFDLGGRGKRSIKFRASRMETGGVVATFEDISREVDAATKIEHMVRYDRLTGLMNRNQLPGHIDTQLNELQDAEKCILLLVNLDRFKQVNDTLGHSKGDILLRIVAERLSKLTEGLGVCARYGGDEFAVVIRAHESLDVAAHLADAICDSFGDPFRVSGRKVSLECSIGIVMSDEQSKTAEQMLKNADLALLSAKKNGRGDWRVFNAEMSREMKRRHKLENDLRVALAGNQFEAHFQPIVNVKEGRVSVCEALLRWKHPTNGYISPASFVPIAEELGLITDIGSWMLFEACTACASWPGGTRVAVNLSPIQFKHGDLAQTVKDALAHSGLEADRLELEITESLMLENVGQTIELLNQFNRMGVRISLDDFGTGYSSLSYMNELPLDKVKIDRSFILDLQANSNSLTLVQAVTALGQKLGLTVVVEGIETKEQLKLLLLNTPIDEIQGYLFSKPVNGEAVRPLLDKRQIGNKSMLANLNSSRQLVA